MRSINKKGFSIIEMLIYLAITSLMLWVITNTLTSMVRTERIADSSKALENTAIFSLERITREIRNAKEVSAGSVLDVNPGTLILTGVDASGASRNIEFFLLNGVIHIKENGVDIGPLNESKTRITNLTFQVIDNIKSKSVRVTIIAESGSGPTYKQEIFYSTTILRGSF